MTKKKKTDRVAVKSGEQWFRESDEAAQLRLAFCGSEDVLVAADKIAHLTGWHADQVIRWPWEDFHDTIRILMCGESKSDQRKSRACWLQINGMTWKEVCKAIDGTDDPDAVHAFGQEMRRHATKHDIPIRAEHRGRPSRK